MLKKIVDIAHDMLLENIKESDIAIDFTCGSGNDSKFLCDHVKHVHSYDIQIEALNEAKELLKDYQNVSFYHKSHFYFDEDVQSFDKGIFNLGYYPKGDKSITTNGFEVVETLKKACCYLNHDGKILVVCYPGFEAGMNESILVENYLKELSSKEFDVYSFKLLNRKNAPYIIGIEKH